MRAVRDDVTRSLQPQRMDPPQRDAASPRQEYQEPNRMSPAERRQLRRDIDDAGREIYRRHPSRPAHE